MSTSIGAINVPRMIWTSTILTLGSLFICWYSCTKENPTIMDTAMEYPYTIIFRVGMMYSLFIYFLQFFFIKWWLDSSQFSKNTKLMVASGTIGLAAYGLFVSCIDRKRINYPLASAAVSWAAIGTSLAIFIIMKNLKKDRIAGLQYINETSWILKKLFSFAHLIGVVGALLIYTGQWDVWNKVWVEYLTVISTILFFWTFTIDFKKFKMDVEKLPGDYLLQQQ